MTDLGERQAESPRAGELPAASARIPLRIQVAETLDRANLTLLASALAFDAMLTFIPLAILIVAGLGHLLEATSYFGAADPTALIVRILPQHQHGGPDDPFALVERLIGEISGFRTRLTWVLAVAFVWLSTRLFGAIRVCLSQIFQVRQRPQHPHFVLSYIIGYVTDKARDIVMVAVVVALALSNMVLSGALRVLGAQGVTLRPPWTFLVTTAGYILGHGVAFGCGLALFMLLYRYASPKRLAWSGALLAGGFATLGFEAAKWLYAFYLTHAARGGQYSVDAGVGAILLLVLWIWYMSLVFLIGAAMADVWDRARRHRALGGA